MLGEEITVNSLDLKAVACLGAGLSNAATAERLGCSERLLYKRKNENPAFYDEWTKFFDSVKQETRIRAAEIDVSNIRKEYEKRLGPAFAALDEGLASGDIKVALQAAREVREAFHGKAHQTMDVRGQVDVNHIHQVPAHVLDLLDTASQSTAELLSAIPHQKVIEGEVVD